MAALSAYTVGALGVQVVTKEEMTPEVLKENLTEKYQGRINGIENLARSSGDSVSVSMMLPLKSKIDTAVNQLKGMGSVDVDAVTQDIEKLIHQSLTSIFKQSIAVAEKTATHEVSSNLFAISPWNKKIVWNPAKTHVLMLTWVPHNARGEDLKKKYEDMITNKAEMTIAWDAWVTAVPEIKDFLKEYTATNKSGFNVTDRIEQYLGLIPSQPPYSVSQDKYFVEMWVRPEDLFRPCLDGEIVDTECTVDPHESDLNNLPPVYRDMSKLIPMTAQHKAWFEKEKKGKYAGDWAMPWTRFGYTYDWGSSKKSSGKRAAQGASEYLIKSGSKVMIHSVTPTDGYSKITTPASGYTARQ